MARFLSAALVLVGFVAPSISTALPERDVLAAPHVVKLPITAVSTTQKKPFISSSKNAKRQIPDPVYNDQNGLEYLINIAIGTPPQNVTCVLDTGSSDTWVNPTCNNGQRPATCASFPRYAPTSSKTAKSLGIVMDIAYGSGTTYGDYYSDTVTLGGSKVTGQQFGVANTTNGIDTGLMGIGWGMINAGTTYNNIIDTLALQNVTQSRAFSLDLGSIDTASGSVIFGGIDTKKYTGALQKAPIIKPANAPDKFPRYWINMNSVGVTTPANITSKKGSTPVFTGTQPVFLDSGGTLSQLPSAIVKPIVTLFGATSVGSGQYTVPCSLRNVTGSVEFGFGKTIISVPYHQFIWVARENLCALGVMETDVGDPTYVLGDTFLRSAYVVYDQDNANLHLAPSANCGTNLVAIGKGVDAVPSVTGGCAKKPLETGAASL